MWHTVVRFGLLHVFYPCLMLFGTIGNILCLKILLRKRFRYQSTCQYLCILAVIDILSIYMRSTRYLYRHIFDVDLRNTSLWICRTFIFFSSTLSHLASWILVVVSFDRYFIIKNFYPRRRVGWRVIKSTFILIFILCIANIHYFHILGTTMHLRIPIVDINDDVPNETYYTADRFVCIARSSFEQFFRLYVPIFDLLLVTIIPFLLMTWTNVSIIRTIMRSNTPCITSRKQQRNNRLTIMLLSVTLAFMLLTCPYVVYICLNRLTSSTTVSNTKLIILDLLESLWCTKHALNFILYTLSGQDFRREFLKLFPCDRRRTSNVLQQANQQNVNNRTSMTATVALASIIPLAHNPRFMYKKKQQYTEIVTSTLMVSTVLRRNDTDDRSDNGGRHIEDGGSRSYFLLAACSSEPTPTSTISNQDRSSTSPKVSLTYRQTRK